MKTTKPTHRRNFLLAAGLGTAGAVAAVATKAGAPTATKSLAEEAAKPSGYHASEHIRKYYKTTEV
ncbi:MAG TPA: formate dehydrogenase [Usitatibacter sp.]|nr:formate dehydrogenase [Usitatibacter sp.]